jgi:predicted RNase H-like HicB family nuclease
MTNAVELRTLADYLKLNYPIVLHADSEGGYVAEIKDLPGCLTQGEILKNINEARELWLETVFELGKSILLILAQKIDAPIEILHQRSRRDFVKIRAWRRTIQLRP